MSSSRTFARWFSLGSLLALAGCSSASSDAPAGDLDAAVDDASVDGGADASPPGYTLEPFKAVRIGSYNSTGYTVVGQDFANVDFHDGPFASARLVVDLASTCYPFDWIAKKTAPEGQNWPADCDAFDRNFSFYVDDAVEAGAAGDGGDAAAPPPPFEIAHAITPFGGPEHFEVDLTDFANALPGSHRLRVDLGSYSDGAGKITGSNAGWTVSARIEVVQGAAPRRVLAAIPLVAGTFGDANALPTVPFEVPAGTTHAHLEYRTSGHGGGPVVAGCAGPAEEFCHRSQHLVLDGNDVDSVDPWRDDCDTLCTLTHYGPATGGFDYCLENPCGAIGSVNAPRANWCPGSMTAPFTWDDLPALVAPGAHTFGFTVSRIASGGIWDVSAIYYAYGD